MNQEQAHTIKVASGIGVYRLLEEAQIDPDAFVKWAVAQGNDDIYNLADDLAYAFQAANSYPDHTQKVAEYIDHAHEQTQKTALDPRLVGALLGGAGGATIGGVGGGVAGMPGGPAGVGVGMGVGGVGGGILGGLGGARAARALADSDLGQQIAASASQAYARGAGAASDLAGTARDAAGQAYAQGSDAAVRGARGVRQGAQDLQDVVAATSLRHGLQGWSPTDALRYSISEVQDARKAGAGAADPFEYIGPAAASLFTNKV